MNLVADTARALEAQGVKFVTVPIDIHAPADEPNQVIFPEIIKMICETRF